MGWLSGYQYRKKVTISGSSGAGENYQVKLSIGSSSGGDFHLEGHCHDFPNDIRFTDDDGITLLDYWIEDTSADPITVWVKVKDNLDNDVDIYVYYGKEGDSSASNGENTFVFFDDFEGTSLDTDKWNSSGTIEVSNSEISLNEDDGIYTKSSWGYGYSVISKAKGDEQDIEFVAFRSSTAVNPDDSISIVNSDYKYPDDFDRYNCKTRKDNAGNNYYVDNQLDFRGTYRKYEITRLEGESKYYQDNNLMYIRTSALPTVNLGIGAVVWDSSQASTLSLDWILVRKYTSPEPSFSSAGNEEIDILTCVDIIESIDVASGEGGISFFSVSCTDILKSTDSSSHHLPWLLGFTYRRRIVISGSSGAGTGCQIKLLIGSSSGGDFHLNGHCDDFPNDIRFTKDDGITLLSYWIEDPTQDPITVWVKIDDNLDDDVNIYCYYGSSLANSTSDGNSVFEFFDDFEPTNLVSWNYEDYGFGDKTNLVFVHDIDGDGQKEIILGRMCDANKFVVLNHDGSHRFTFTGDDTNISFNYHAIAFGDINGDGKDEIIFGSDKVYAIDCNGNKVWSYDPGTLYRHSSYYNKDFRVIALDAKDIDEDGDIETVAMIYDSSADHTSEDYVVDCIKQDGSGRKWRWGPPGKEADAHYLLLARLDQSSNCYYVIFADYDNLWCLKHDGTEHWHNTDAKKADMYMAVNVNESSDNLEVLACGYDNFCAINLDGSMYWKYNTGHTQEFDVADVNNDGHYEIGVFNNYDDHLFIFSHDGNKLYDGYVDGVGWTGLINAVKVEGNWYFAIGDRLYNHNGCVGKCLKFIGTTKHFNYKHHVFGYSLDFDNDGVDELVGDNSIGEIEIAPWTAQSGCFDIVEESAGNGIIKGSTTGTDLVTHNTADIGVGKVIRAKIRPDDDYGALGVIFGYQNSSNFYYVRVENENDELQIYEWVSASASKRGSVSVIISTGTWYILEAIWSEANSIEAKLYDAEGNELATTSATMTGGFSSGKIGFRSHNIGSYDVFHVRKYASPEPTFSSVQAEEGPVFTCGDTLANLSRNWWATHGSSSDVLRSSSTSSSILSLISRSQDSLGLIDSDVSSAILLLNAIDSIDVSDGCTLSLSFTSSCLDVLHAIDSASYPLPNVVSCLDSLGTQDSISSFLSMLCQSKDNIGGADGETSQLSVERALLDILAFQDTSSYLAGIIASASDVLNVQDLNSIRLTFSCSSIDVVKNTDSGGVNVTFHLDGNDILKGADFVSGNLQVLLDSLSVFKSTDQSASSLLGFILRSATDVLDMYDLNTATLQISSSSIDIFRTEDNSSINIMLHLNSADVLKNSDSAILSLQALLSALETLKASDSSTASVFAEILASASDLLATSDYNTVRLEFLGSAIDIVESVDNASSNVILHLNSSDLLGGIDRVTAKLEALLSAISKFKSLDESRTYEVVYGVPVKIFKAQHKVLVFRAE